MAARTSFADEPMTAIVAAMEEEVAALRARLANARPAAVSGARVTLGHLGGAPVALAVTGDGQQNARRGLAALLAAQPVGRVLVAGVAGALSPDLEAGALAIADRVLDEQDGHIHVADGALLDLAARACAATRAVAVTATRIADTAQEKCRLLALARAGSSSPSASAVVDLESAAFAATARRAGIPWLVVRAVSDTAGESVPALLNRSRDTGGAVRRGRVVFGLLADPGALRSLLALRERVRTCASALARALEVTMQALAAEQRGAVQLSPAPAPHMIPDSSNNPLQRRNS